MDSSFPHTAFHKAICNHKCEQWGMRKCNFFFNSLYICRIKTDWFQNFGVKIFLTPSSLKNLPTEQEK